MTPTKEIVEALRGEATDWGDGMATVGTSLLLAAANALEAADGITGQVVLLKEALDLTEQALEAETADWKYSLQFQQVAKVKALPLPQAAAQVAEWREGHENWKIFQGLQDLGFPITGKLIAEWKQKAKRWDDYMALHESDRAIAKEAEDAQ